MVLLMTTSINSYKFVKNYDLRRGRHVCDYSMHGQSRWQPGPKRESGASESKSRQNGCVMMSIAHAMVKRHYHQAMKHAGVAITVTSFTDAAAFFIGASTVWFQNYFFKINSKLFTSISCRACQYYEHSASLLELEWSSSTSLHAHTLLPALSWMSGEGNHLCS